MKERAERIEQLRRAEARRRMLPSWLARFHDVTGIELSPDQLLSEEATSTLRREFYTRLSEARATSGTNWSISEPAGAFEVIHRAADALGNDDLIVLHANDHILGAIQLNATTAIAAAAQIWIIADEDLRMSTPNGASGFCLGFEYYSLAEEYFREGIYELVPWGVFSKQAER
jgi:hypothetical protein